MLRIWLIVSICLFIEASWANNTSLFSLGHQISIEDKDQRIPFSRLLSHKVELEENAHTILKQPNFEIALPEGFNVEIETTKYETKENIHYFVGKVKKDPQSQKFSLKMNTTILSCLVRLLLLVKKQEMWKNSTSAVVFT